MPNDAKLGLVIGVGLVIAVAVVFFRKDLVAAKPGGEGTSAVAVNPANSPPPATSPTPSRSVAALTADRAEAGLTGQHHTVQEGETLFSLARRYYGNEDRFVDIYRVNREVVKTPEQLTPGTVLVIPEVEDRTDSATDSTDPSH